MADSLNVDKIKSLSDALERTANGKAAVELARKLGIWTATAHAAPSERPRFRHDLSEIAHSQLSDILGAWSAELGRITELHGAFVGQENALKIEMKAAQARARSRIRRQRETDNLKPLSLADLKDEADEQTDVIDLYDRASILAIVMASTAASKEATQQYVATISREIAFRDAQIKGRIYG